MLTLPLATLQKRFSRWRRSRRRWYGITNRPLQYPSMTCAARGSASPRRSHGSARPTMRRRTWRWLWVDRRFLFLTNFNRCRKMWKKTMLFSSGIQGHSLYLINKTCYRECPFFPLFSVNVAVVYPWYRKKLTRAWRWRSLSLSEARKVSRFMDTYIWRRFFVIIFACFLLFYPILSSKAVDRIDFLLLPSNLIYRRCPFGRAISFASKAPLSVSHALSLALTAERACESERARNNTAYHRPYHLTDWPW